MSRVLVVEDEAHLAQGLRFTCRPKDTRWKLPETARRPWSDWSKK